MKTIHWLPLLLAFAITGAAQSHDLRAVRATSQQILISYTAPAGAPCRIEVSESSSYSPLVHDVNGTLFPGSEYDLSRAGSHVNGDKRVVVIGKRAVERATNGRRYSRSLQAVTPYYIRLSECGESATLSAGTRTIPFNVMTDVAPAHSDEGMSGYYGFPSTNPTDRSETIIDHLTGAPIRKIQLPGDVTSTRTGTLGTPVGANWTNPAGATGAGVAEYSGTAQEPLFIPNMYAPGTHVGPYAFNVKMTAQITGGAIGDDAKAQICIGTATACESEWQDVTIGAGLSLLTAGSTQDYSTAWMKNREFPVEKFLQSGGAYGFLVRKKSTNPDHTLRIDTFSYTIKLMWLGGSSTSVYEYCSTKSVSDNGDGKTYALCAMYDRATHNPMIYSIDVDSGEAHFIGPGSMQTSVNGSPQTRQMNAAVFDHSNPRVFYDWAFVGNTTRLYKCTIASTPGLLSINWSGTLETQPPHFTCVNMTPSGYTITEQVAALHPDFSSEWASLANSSATNGWVIHMMQSGKIVLKTRVNQDYGHWVAIYDPGAQRPAGCSGCVGRIVAATPMGASASPQPRKFCTLHSISPTPETDWIYMGLSRQGTSQNSAAWGGPWRIQVKKPGCDLVTQDCKLSASDTEFELIPQSGSYNWNDPQPGATEDANLPLEVGDLFIYTKTDNVQWVTGNEYMEVIAKNDVTHTITVRRGTNILTSPWIAGSGWDSNSTITNTAQTLPEGAYLYGICRATAVNYDYMGIWVWNFTADPLGKTFVQPAHNGVGIFPPQPGIYPASSGYASPNIIHFTNFGSHGVYAAGIRMQFTNRGCPNYNFGGRNNCYVSQTQSNKGINILNAPPDRTFLNTPVFGGKQSDEGAYESHVQRRQSQATGKDFDYVMDIRPLVGASVAQTNALVAGTTNVYRLSGVTLRRKHFATLALSGDRILTDISGPGSLIDDSKSFTYCVALTSGECRPGSAVGDVYANSPMRNYSGCTDGFPPDAYPVTTYGICILDRAPYTIGPVQTDISRSDYSGSRARLLALHQLKPLVQSRYSVSQPLLNGKWALYLGEDHGFSGFNLVKASSLPENTSTDPLGFERVRVALGSAPAGTDNVVVDFGYAEHGPSTEYWCTSRKESCVIAKAKVQSAEPFQFASETASGIPWSSGLVIEIPRIPGRVVFSRIRFRNAAGQVVAMQVMPPM
jgi:hypothetical protein